MEDGLFMEAFSFTRFINMLNIDRDFNEFYEENGKNNFDMIVKRLKSIELN